jgi:hypothetical protein
MNFSQFRLLALFVAIVAASNATAQSVNDIPDLNSPQSINSASQGISNGINDKGQELNTAVLNLGQSVNKLGYGPVREFGTDAGLAIKQKAQPYVDAATAGLAKIQSVATTANADVSGGVSAIASVIKEGEQTFISKAQAAFPPGLTNNAMFAQATNAFSQALGATSGSSAGLPAPLRTAAKEYASKIQSQKGYSKLSTDAGKTDIIRAVAAQLGAAFNLDTDKLNVPKSALPKRSNLPLVGSDGSDDPFEDALSSFVDEVNAVYPSDLTPHALIQKLLSAFRSATKTSLPSKRDDKFAKLDQLTQAFMNKYKSHFTPSDFTDGSDFFNTLAKELASPSDEGSVENDDENLKSSTTGASASVPKNADGGVVASDGVHTVSIKRRMQHRRRAMLN